MRKSFSDGNEKGGVVRSSGLVTVERLLLWVALEALGQPEPPPANLTLPPLNLARTSQPAGIQVGRIGKQTRTVGQLSQSERNNC